MYPDTSKSPAGEGPGHSGGSWPARLRGLDAAGAGRHNCAAVGHPAVGGADHRIILTRERT